MLIQSYYNYNLKSKCYFDTSQYIGNIIILSFQKTIELAIPYRQFGLVE